MKKSKNEIESFLISSRSGRTDISKYNVFEFARPVADGVSDLV